MQRELLLCFLWIQTCKLKSHKDDFTTFSSIFPKSLKDINFGERHLQFFISFFLLKCVSNFMLTSWVRFFFFLRSDNHSKTLVCFFPGVPSNPRTSLDYMKGLFEEIEDSSEVTKNLSPFTKKRIEQQSLQSSSGQMRRYE